tara:strand:+ start:1413 stop:2219 length:807 start_codon:yes stop_codon:yes gene_type:complete
MKNNLPIGIFDSGLGGLTVLKSLQQLLPHESFIYIGDTAHVPYGNKSKDVVRKYSQQITKFLIKKNVKLIVVACNTASSVAIRILQKKFKTPIIDVISPLQNLLDIDEYKKIKKIGIIGTYNTIQSKAYNRVLSLNNKNIIIVSKACPLFVPIIEEGFDNHDITKSVAHQYLKYFNDEKIDLLVLGCTHYPIILKTIQNVLFKHIKIVDSALITAQYVKNFLIKQNLGVSVTKNGTITLMVTDKVLHFRKFAQYILNDQKLDIKEINI